MEAPQGQQEISNQQLIIPAIEPGTEAETPEPEKPFAEFESKVNAVVISPQGQRRIAVGLIDGTIEIWDLLTGEKWSSCQGHKGSVNSVAFSSDGSKLVSGSSDNTVRLWDAETGEAIGQPFFGHTSNVISVAFSPDGTQVVSGSADNTVRLWDAKTGNAIGQPFSGDTVRVYSVAFNHDGTQVVSGSADNTVRLWDAKTGNAIGQPFTGHTEFVRSVAFSPDGSMVVSGSGDNTVRLWDAKTGNAIGQPFTGHTSNVISVAFNHDGTQVVSGSEDKTVRLWDAKTGNAIGQPFIGHTEFVNSVAFSPDGSMVVSGSGDNTVRLWDAKTGNAIGQPFIGHTEFVNSVAFSPDGSMVVSGSGDNTVRLWDAKTGNAIGQPFTGHTEFVRSVAFSPDGKTVISGSGDNTVRLWDAKTGAAIGQPFSGHTNSVNSVAFNHDGTQVVSSSFDNTVRVWDAKTGNAIGQPFTGHTNGVMSVAFNHDGTEVVSGSKDNTVRLWDAKTGNAIGQPFSGHVGIVMSAAFNHDGTQVVSGGADERVRLWDAKTGAAIGQPFSGHTSILMSVAFNHDGTQVVSGSGDKTVRLWDAKTGAAIGQPFSGHTSILMSVAFNHDGTQVVSGSGDKTVRLWDAKTGAAIGQPFSGHTSILMSVAFNHDGTQVVSGSGDKTVRLWDAKTGNAIGQPFTGHTGGVYSVAFSPDSSMVVSGSGDNTVRLWDISDPQHKRQIEIGEHQGKVSSVAFDPLGDYIISAGEDGIKVWRWQRFNITRVPQAFRNDQATGEDSLDVAKELQSLADVLMLRSLEPPLAVAILGSWGSGKSFGMHLIEKHITKIRCQQITAKQTWGEKGDEPNLSPYVGHVYQIKFNAWSYAKSDLWASLMQTIFDQLDRQLTLEKQLGEVSNLLAGGDVWRVINQMNDSDRKAILESELSKEVFAKFKEKNADGNALWDILSEVREEEQKKLEQTEQELQNLEAEVKSKNQEIENKFNLEVKQLEQEFNQEVKKIEVNVEEEMTDLATLIIFLSQLKETLKDDFGDSILKDFLNSCGFKDKKDLETQFPLLKLDKLADSNLLDVAQELIAKKDDKIKLIINNVQKITHFLEEQPSNIVGLIEFTKKDKKTLFIFLGATALPFIAYFLIVSVIPKFLPALLEISTALKLWLTSVAAIPAISVSMEILKKIQILQVKTVKFLQVARENIKEEKQKLIKTKDEKVKEQINQRKSEYEQNQVKEISANKEAAKQEITEKEQEIEKLQLQVERQKQRVGLTAQYKSLLDFVNNRLEDNSYRKLLGLMHQIQDDLADLSDHLTYKPGNTNPEKLKALKKYFPRGSARIVLYIDDLDRCPPDRVVQVLEAVQLLLNTEIFVVILAIDDRYIGRALEHNYRGVLKRGGTPSGVDYIEKIIQIPYRMRPISREVAEKYLKSLVDIEEESKKDSQNISNSQQIIDENLILQQTTGENSIPLQQVNDESSFLKELEQFPEKSYQDEIEEIPVDTEAQTEQVYNLPVSTSTKNLGVKGISESRTREDNSKENNRKIQHSANTDPLVTFERFTAEEFKWIKECCQHVDLTPRTAKRLINICKIIKIIWTPTENDATWKVEPTPECKQTLIAFLALAGRYPKEIRKILEDIYLEFEEEGKDTVEIEKNKWLNYLQKLDVFMDRYNQREWKKFKNDFEEMPPRDKFLFEKRTFNLARSFCFVGDIGYDPDDHYNREYRFEDKKKDYGFYRENL
ncbi:P-loop NTPase fold protein [Trichormus sp. NMC-1]|uniref:P-loop NTPase fold protein n=1 Tax=Trichormus sp. NMC-1 TaxID=1853259 RepID=UPI0009F1BE3C|nr:P-loop NTPase fold protein [Trichormus sp. NMC-1]